MLTRLLQVCADNGCLILLYLLAFCVFVLHITWVVV